MSSDTDISLCVNLHREGRLCLATLESAIKSISFASGKGLSCELIIVLDNPDPSTEDAALLYGNQSNIVKISVADLGAARNNGIAAARGRYCALLDGDDIICDSWLWAAHTEAEASPDREVVVHPRMNLFFGRNIKPYYWKHPDMRKDDVRLSRLMVENLWTSLSFSSKKVYNAHPFIGNQLSEGFGYEDWSWNISTIMAGAQHITAENTIHFIRKKASGSLLQASVGERVLPNLKALNITEEILEKLRVD